MNLLRFLARVGSIRSICAKFCTDHRGKVFDNTGSITEEDFAQIKSSIDVVLPKVFLEIGTGQGISTIKIFDYLRDKCPSCQFYTMDINRHFVQNIVRRYGRDKNFHALHGLSVLRDETTSPAFEELEGYNGPQDRLRSILKGELKGVNIDIAFIDSRKGTAVAEFRILERHLSPDGIIYCHDVMNGGKGIEVLEYLEQDQDRFDFEIIDSGPEGLIKIETKWV